MAEAEEAEGGAAPSDAGRSAAPRIECALPEGAARCVPETSRVARAAPASRVARVAAIDSPTPRRAPPRSWIAQLVLAGVFGGGVAAFVFGVVWMIDAARIARPLSNGPTSLVFALDALAGVAVALRFGFGSRARGARDLVLRGIGALVFGAMAWGAILGAVFALGEMGSSGELRSAVWFTVLGLVVAVVGFLLERRKARPVAEPLTMMSEDRRNAPLAWSGLLAASLGAWSLASLDAYGRSVEPIHNGPATFLVGVGICGAFALATSRGYASGVRERIRLGRRLGGTIGIGFLAGLALVALFAIFVSVESPNRSTERSLQVFGPAFVALVALAGIHFLTPTRRRSLRSGVIVASLVLCGTLYTQSAWVRYAVGNERAAFQLANEHYEDGDFELSVRYFEIACDRGDDLACVRASAQYDAGLGVRADARRADALLRLACDDPDACLELANDEGRTKERATKRACDLGGGKYCDRYRAAVLSGACDKRDVFACRDLARMSGNGMAPFFYQKACGFGDVEACAMAH